MNFVSFQIKEQCHWKTQQCMSQVTLYYYMQYVRHSVDFI